eukprot:6395949-Ditylum_brightwellii.AAC.1
MLKFLRYIPKETIDMKTLREDEDLEETIGNRDIFKYHVYHGMKEFRVEIRKIIVRLALVTVASEDRNMTNKSIKEKEETVGNMSCQGSLEIQTSLRILDRVIRGTGSKKSTTVVLPKCNGIIHTVKQKEVK